MVLIRLSSVAVQKNEVTNYAPALEKTTTL